MNFLRSDNARRYVRQLPRYPKQPLDRKFPNMGPAAIDLVEHMLRFDPQRRITGQFLNLTLDSVSFSKNSAFSTLQDL